MKPKIILILTYIFNAKSEIYFSETDIPEMAYLDPTTDPCDNFYQFTCGNFAAIHPRPSTLNILDQFTLLRDELVQIGKEILSYPETDTDPTALRKAKKAYNSCVNVKLQNSRVPELRTIKEFGGMPFISSSNDTINFSWNDIGKLVSEYGVPLIFTYNVVQKSQNESMIGLNWDTLPNPSMLQPNLAKNYDKVLEDSFEETAKSRMTRSNKAVTPLDIFLQTVIKNLLNYTSSDKPIKEVIAEWNKMWVFVKALYAGGLKEGTILPLEPEVTVRQLQEWTNKQFGEETNIDWVEYLNNVFKKSGVEITPQVKIYHQSIERIYEILNLVKHTNPRVIKNFALLRVFTFQAFDSDYTTRKAYEDFYKTKNYTLHNRWEYCTRKILDVVAADSASLSYAVTYAYQRDHFNKEKLTQASEMIKNVQTAFEENLKTADWMDDNSHSAALAKVKNMLVLLGYPEFVENQTSLDQFYKNLRISEFDSYENARAIRAFKQAYQFTQLGKPQRTFWGYSTLDPNAHYNNPNNKIVVPISMLNLPFFSGNNPILDYSRLGILIGHEITHGFDVSGKNYDLDGKLKTWWSQKTLRAFSKRTVCFKRQYNQYYVPEIKRYVNGSYCINENLADNVGIKASFKAFKTVVETQQIKSSGDYTIEQQFFIGYGTMWCSNPSNYYLTYLHNSNYPPKKYRVIGTLSNMEEFSKAFNCPVGSKMNPVKKCKLW